MKQDAFALHAEEHGKAIWTGRYKGPLQVAHQQYKAAHAAYGVVTLHQDAYIPSRFGVSEIDPWFEIQGVKQDLVVKGMTYASTLFSAINSLPGLIPWRRREMLFTLREVVGEMTKCDTSSFPASQKEVLVACLVMLEKCLRGVHANKDYYSAAAAKLVNEVIYDSRAPYATQMLVLARASSLTSIPEEKRKEYASAVLTVLYDIRNSPHKIRDLAQDWKTYVRLSRMVYSWGDMFFGLRYDKSIDLHLKSYLFFAANFYK